MTIEETAMLLAEVQLIDNRKVDEQIIVAWHVLVGDLDYAMAREAVVLHRRESPAWLTPAHVRSGVERILLAALGERQDEWGNVLEADQAAVAALGRLRSARLGVES